MSAIDWRGLMQAGLHGLGLEPEVFWRLTPVELKIMPRRWVLMKGQGAKLSETGIGPQVSAWIIPSQRSRVRRSLPSAVGHSLSRLSADACRGV